MFYSYKMLKIIYWLMNNSTKYLDIVKYKGQ